MGTEAIKIAELDVKKLLDHLNKAYCDEWLAFYAYWYMGKVVSGMAYEDMGEFLNKTAMNELEHAEELTKRMMELGGQPQSDFSSIVRDANVKYPAIPARSDDYHGIIDTVLKSEAGAIEVYEALAKETFGKDHVTYQLVMHILSEETAHEERFQSLKGTYATEPAPSPVGAR